MHIRQHGFTYIACGSFAKNKKEIEKFKETKDTKHIYPNEPDRACFQHVMAYGDFNDLPRRTAADKTLLEKAINIANKS